jgi:GntR family transcriptional regulator
MPRHMTFRQIADDIAARIGTGEYSPSSKIPSYQQLANLYSVSISTAQRAILILQERGMVYGEPGRGVFVRDDIG